jgi:site-specific DNA-methyltransferase (adenine-specific)
VSGSRLLCYGDNLDVLREHVASESVDLVYLDPPFNSQRNFNILFQEHDTESRAQIRAFEDCWRWDVAAEETFAALTGPGAEERGVPAKLVTLAEALRSFLGPSDMMAYLAMMAARLVELHRVLKPTGSIYLHCDPTASHYLKLLLDAIFGPERFLNEIIWRRTNVHGDAKHWPPLSDTLLFYSKGRTFTWNPPYLPLTMEHVEAKYGQREADGRRYSLSDMRSPNPRPNLMYEWEGHQPHPNGWAYSRETMERLDREGRIWYPNSKDKRPRLKRYLDERPGTLIGNIWTDIDPINSQAKERLGYATQKPLALLERIIQASSNEGDLVLDPFCGCGTAIHAAERLKRGWIGIDITHLAIALIRNRLTTAFPGIEFEVRGEPADPAGALSLAEADPYQFQWWALHLIGARPVGDGGEAAGREGKKGRDRGIDGAIRFRDDPKAVASQRVIVSVKAGRHLAPSMVRDLVGTVQREKAPIGVLFTMHEPTAEMRAEAAKAGQWTSPTWGRAYQRLQLITVEEAFAGKRVEYPGQDVTLQTPPTDQPKTEQLDLLQHGARSPRPSRRRRDPT